MSVSIIDRAGKYLKKHNQKGIISYLIYFSVFLFMALAIIFKLIFTFLFAKKLRHQ
jgi:hypothetical protein